MKHYLGLSALAGGLSLVIVVLQYLAPGALHRYVWESLFFLLFLSLLNHVFLQWVTRKRPGTFLLFFFISVFKRLFLSVLFILYCVKESPSDKKLFVANFFILYFVFLGFDIWGIMANLRPHLKSKRN